MRNHLKTLALGLVALLAIAACATKGNATDTLGAPAPSFDAVLGKTWALEELVSESGKTIINRQKLEADGMGDAFTLLVNAERVSGVGSPNRYTSPYKLGEDQEISISPMAGTRMMGLAEPEGLQEQEYYNYLGQVNQWLLTGDRLELYSETPDGDQIILVFASKGAKTDGD